MKNTVCCTAFITLVWFISGCTDPYQGIYERTKAYIDQIKIIDTHEHHGFPFKNRHNCFYIGMYMYADLVASGMPEISDSMDAVHDPEAYWDHFSEYVRFSRGTSYHAQFIKNLQQAYGLQADEITKEDFLRISSLVDSNFRSYESWLQQGLEKSNIELMLVDRVWDPFNPVMEHPSFGYVFRFDNLILEVSEVAAEKKITQKRALQLINKPAYGILTLADYLAYIDSVFAVLELHQVMALKSGLAYFRSIDYDAVTPGRASVIFNKQNPDDKEIKELQDFLFYYIIHKAGEMDLPVQIHTGYLHGNRAQLDQGEPMKLLTLFQDFPGTRFVLFHGGYPWTGDWIILGKSFPNVYLDLVWLPQLSRTRAMSVLHELLDAVPYNKICWGGDVGKIDETLGSLELGKEVVATVLAERIHKGWISENTARDIARRVFRENAIDLYHLKAKRGLDY